jgi:hypothetical protein
LLVTSASGPNGNGYGAVPNYVTMRRRSTILGLPASLDDLSPPLLSDGVVSFPRGFGFASNGEV